MMRYTEMQLNEPTLDQPFPDSYPTKVVIATSPRSGSFMLCRLMINAGLGVPHEYFNPLHFRIMGKRLGVDDLDGPDLAQIPPSAYNVFLDKLMARRSLNGVFAAKLQYWEYACFLSNVAGARLFSDAHVIYLHREDVLRQAISLHFARMTGRWGFDDAVTTAPHPTPDLLDFEAIDRALGDVLAEDYHWRQLFARNGIKPLTISYEKLSSEPESFLKSLADRIGFDSDKLRLDYRETEEYGTSGKDCVSKSEVRQRYIKSRRVLHDTVQHSS
jgi:LPS sulfotransferase NodH